MLPVTRSLALAPRRPDSLALTAVLPPPNDVEDDTSFSLTPSLSLLRAGAPNFDASRSETRVPPLICRDDEGEDDEILEPSSFFPPSLPTKAEVVLRLKLLGTDLAVILKEPAVEEEEDERKGEVTSETVLGFDVSTVTLVAGLETPPGSLMFVVVVVAVELGFWWSRRENTELEEAEED